MSDDDFLAPGGALRGMLFNRLIDSFVSARTPKPGQRIGAFRIARELGHGGMGTVFLAERADGVFEQQVALKWIRGEVHSAAMQLRAQRERELLAGLDHPNIARLIDGGRSDEGCLWFAMEYVDGLRLDQHVQERGLDLWQRLSLLVALCDAVGFAHQRLVIHRDIKPSNVMVARAGQVKLLDFGIAALTSEEAPGSNAMTPAWASPEQRRGDAVTTASDIYQLGLLLAFLIEAHTWQPHASTGLSGTHSQEALIATLPTRKPIKDRDLAAIVERATAADPGARYASAAALAADLRAWRTRHPVAARDGGGFYVVGRYAARHPLALTLTMLASVTLLALAFALALQRNAAQREAQHAANEAAHARLEAERAQSAVAFMGELLGQAQPGVHRGKLPTVADALAAGGERLLMNTTMPASLRGELLARLGAIHIERSEFGQARRLLEAAVPALRAPNADRQRRAEALGYLGYSLDYKESVRALALLDEAIALLADGARDDELRLRFQRLRASILFGTGRTADAAAALQATLDAAERALGVGHVEVAMDHVMLAMALNASGRSAAALAHAERGYRDLQTALGADHPRSIQAGNSYAAALYNLSRFEEQERVLTELLQHAVKLWGDAHPRYALLLTWQGAARLALHRPADALPVLERAAAIYDACDPNDDLGSPNTLGALGDAYADLGRNEEALAAYQRMFARERERTTALPPDDGTRALKVARLLTRMGRTQAAQHAIDEAQRRADASAIADPAIREKIAQLRTQLSGR